MTAPLSLKLTGHPITRVATLPAAHPGGVLLICAGGSAVSVQAAPRSLLSLHPTSHTHPSSGSSSGGLGGSNNAQLSAMAAAAAGGSGLAGTGASAGTCKGPDALLAAVQEWFAASSPSAAAQAASASLLPEQRVTLQAGGEVTSLAVAALPGSDVAVAVVGTTAGTVALCLVEGSQHICVVAECPLAEWSGGRITAEDAVVDVAFSMDPAGRPEFVAAATTGCVVVMDVQLLYRARDSQEDEEENTWGEEGEGSAGRRDGSAARGSRAGRASPQPGDLWASSALRARAVEALERPNRQLVQRSRSEVFAAAFPDGNVVRILAPQRLHAAVALDVALLVVLSDGTLHYVERVVEGGSVRLLAEHHRLRFAKGTSFISYGQDSMLHSTTAATAATASRGEEGGWQAEESHGADSRTMPHVVYRYRLSAFTVNICQMLNAGNGGGGGAGKAAGFGPVPPSASAAESITHVNDAALCFSEKTAVCHVVVAGTQLVPTAKPAAAAAARHAFASSQGLGVNSSMDGTGAGGRTLGQLQQQQQVGSCATGGATTGYRALGWWAVVQNVVLPRCTLDRARLERQTFAQHEHTQNHSSSSSSASPQLRHNGGSAANASLNSTAFAAAYTSDAGSPFMIHVQGNAMALPAAPLATSAVHSSNAGRGVATAAAAAAVVGGVGLVSHTSTGSTDGASPASPLTSSPTGTGAHLAAGSTAGGVGCGFAAAAMAGEDTFVLSAGADVYVGEVSAVPAKNAVSLPMLRAVKSFGSVVEHLTAWPYAGDAVLATCGSRVVPVAL